MQTIHSAHYLQPTALLDFDNIAIRHLLHQRGWANLESVYDRVEAVYQYVKDEVLYGYCPDFQIPASKVLKQGMGSNLDKTILLMALLRALGIPCRVQADLIDKVIHRGLLGWLAYKLCPPDIYHTAIQMFYNGRWLTIEGYAVDRFYLGELQAMFPDYSGSFYGYGIAVLNFRNPPTRWEGGQTSIQAKAFVCELGLFDDPDTLFQAHPEIHKRSRTRLYQRVLRPRLNKHIAGIRGKHMPYMQKSFEQGFIEESALKRGRHCTPST